MTLRLHRVPILALALAIAVVAVPAVSATATQFPTAEQIAQHQGTAVAPSTQANVHFPTARQVALHEGVLSGPSLASTVRPASSSGFSWGDAGMGAGAALVLVTALLYGAFTFRNRRQRGLRRASPA
jgi:curli biogenesis system outer membrane secretion channel CsgG